MKEIKSYVRVHMLDKVIRALEKAALTDLLVVDVDVRAITRSIAAEDIEYSVELGERYMDMGKLTVVVRDADAARAVQLIRDHAHTGQPCDGIIFISPVEDAIHICTGAVGEAALGPADH